jgi:hypothetical protein
VLDARLLAGLGMLALERGDDLFVVVGREAIRRKVRAPLTVGTAFGHLPGRDPRHRECLGQIGAREQLQRAGVGDLMHTATHQQIAGQRARGGIIDRLIDLELAVARPGLQKEVVGEAPKRPPINSR